MLATNPSGPTAGVRSEASLAARIRARGRWLGPLVLAGVMMAPPGLAQAGPALRLLPRAGLVAPDRYFYEVFTNFIGDGPMEWTSGRLGRAFAAGVGVEADLGVGGLMLRAEVERSFGGWLLVTHSLERPRVLFDPPQVINTFLDVPATLTFTSLQAVLPTKLELWRVQPYVLLGVGGKRYGFGEPTRPNDVNAVLPSNGFTWGGDLGGGVTLRAFGLEADFQVRDAVTRYWSKRQHDLLFTGGLLWAPW